MAVTPFRRFVTRVAVGALAVAVPVVLMPVPASAAAPSELFLSEYVEGSSQNKAIEVYNGTAAGVNLADQGYNVQFFANANTTAGLTIPLTGTVAAGEVFVLAQASADPAVLAVADQQNTSTSWYNGNDTVVLRKGTTVVDSLGQIASNPTTEWGTGLTSTADNTLRRRASVCAGDTDPTNAFDPSVEWDGFATNTFDGLGSHASDCGGTPPTDAAPTVTAVTPVAGSTAPATTDVVVTFSEAVSAPTSAFALSCAGSPVAFALTGGPTGYTLNPTTDLAADATCTLTVTGSAVSDTDTIDPPDAMAADHTSAFTVAPAPVDRCTLPTTAIGAVQGPGETSPAAGQQRAVRGVVIGDHEGPSPNLRGFYLQDSGDGDAATSDGIFVFNGGNQDLVSLGDVVTVTGTASENQGQTQISTNAAGISVCGTDTVAPTEVALPVRSTDDLEQVEGMLVTYPQDLSVSEHFQLGRFGQVTLSGPDRLDVPTNVVAPGAQAQALQAANSLSKIVLDDSTQAQNPDPVPFARGGQPLSASNTLRGGDTVAGLTGVMTYTWGGNAASPNAYRVRPIRALGGAVDFEPANPRPTERADVGGDVAVGAMNLLNLFNTFSGCQGGEGGASLACRGANSSLEFERQVAKTVAAIRKVDADVLGINEIENDGYGSGSMVQELVDRLNEGRAEAERYTFVDPDPANGPNSLGSDAIKVGMLYQPAEVTPIGTTAVLNTVAFVNGGDPAPRSRPSLAQAFRVNATGGTFVADVNHLKSKGSACSVPDAGDGQGNCNAVRTRSAQELGTWLASDPTGTGEADALILGDLNSYAKEDPIRTLESAGFTNLVNRFVGDDAYSYVFDGQWGYLDHALGSAGIVSQVTGVTEYHVNSDEPAILDYNVEFKSAGQVASLYAPDEFRVSDHDPVIVGLKPNSVPTVEAAFVDGSVSCGTGNASLKVTFTDRDEADTHKATVAWGDGTPDTVVDPARSPLTLAHTYAGAGRHTATVTVTDSHGLSTTRTAAVTVGYTSSGILAPLGTGTTANYGSTVPVRIRYRDCDGTVPTGIAPVVTVGQGPTVLATGSPTLADGEWKYELRTSILPGPGTCTVTVTVPATGQTDSATLTLRR